MLINWIVAAAHDLWHVMYLLRLVFVLSLSVFGFALLLGLIIQRD